ncbi:zinc ribbon domain-containing protein [Desulfosporosinus sp. BG]|uniref:zinc ribbon domain-containing protein n=1 Tax=Desulfosporosinus sp. BG TaxID=1633135 RepID=UPI00083A6A10|nr:zinc ribbon domain-containing protein [Desulfosporosinus sp. BG]ODA42148.1 DNA-directed RNA polymerase, beta' subunit [Desulfosporosinus sp. BG]
MTLTWSERIKLAWTTFKREALPLYGWSFIFLGIGVVLIVATVMSVIAQLRQFGWAFPHGNGSSFSSGMPVPGIPPTPDLSPFVGPFGSSNLGPFNFFGGPLSSLPNLLSAAGSVAGIFLLILIVGWLFGSAFYTGLFNLTAKAYREEKVTFKDFKFKGFFRILGWQGFLLLIKLLLLIIGLFGAYTLSHSHYTLVAFLIVYGLFITAIGLYALPWLITSTIYLLAHSNEGFWDALRGSWRFFQRHLGILWGYIGTVILIEIALQIIGRISHALTGIASLVVSPFIAVLAIVWVMSIEEEPQLYSTAYSAMPYQEAQVTQETINTPPSSESLAIDSPSPETEEPKIDLHKSEPEPSPPTPSPEDSPRYCPSCGRANTGTAYCPQCGTKL